MKKTYKISMVANDYFANHQEIVAYDLKLVDDNIIFDTNKESIEYLDSNNINYIIEKDKLANIKNTIVLKKFVIITTVILLFCLYMNSYRVTNIKFNINTPINDEIADSIEKEYKQLLLFDFVTDDFVDLSKDLRSKYPCYEWISISKDYSTIKVDIIKTGYDKVYTSESFGNIVASKDGVISSYLVYNGTLLVDTNQYVKRGDVLIKGSYEDILTTPKGVVMATTYSEETYRIDKTVYQEKLTGNTTSYYQLDILKNKFDILKDNKYKQSKVQSDRIFNIPNFFEINKIEEYEKNDIIYVNNLESAKEYGFSLVEKNFTDHKVINEEKIIDNKILTINEFDTYFEITYLVKKLESIGKFEELSL